MHPFKQRALLSVLALCFSLAAQASDIQDANTLFKQKDYAKAMDKVNIVLKSSPKDAQARFLKGLIQVEQGDNNAAIDTFTVLTKDHPELPEPYNNLAVLYANQGQYDKARIALEVAIRTHPSYATAHENLGDIYAKMASQAYDRALQLDKSNATTQTKLSLILELFSNKPGARPARNTAVAAAPKPIPTAPAAAAPAAKPAPAAPVAVATAPVAEPAPVVATPITKPEPKKVAQADGSAEAAVKRWASAWQAQNVDQYLAAYAADFKVPGGASRSDWEALRRDRLTKPSFIKVTLENVQVEPVDDSHANVSFRQGYKANHFSGISQKTLVMEKTANGWQIQEERAE